MKQQHSKSKIKIKTTKKQNKKAKNEKRMAAQQMESK